MQPKFFMRNFVSVSKKSLPFPANPDVGDYPFILGFRIKDICVQRELLTAKMRQWFAPDTESVSVNYLYVVEKSFEKYENVFVLSILNTAYLQ